MPRRSFFGGGNRDKKSSSKNHRKLSQKYVQDSLRQQQLQQQQLEQQQKQQKQQQQQQQQSQQQQQQWEGRPSSRVSDVSSSRRSQTSSSQDTPPYQLGGPRQAAPNNAYSQQYVNDINHQRSPPNSSSFQPGGGNNIDGQMLMHQHGTLQQQQRHQYQVQPNNNAHRQQQQQQQQHHQGYEDHGQQHQYQTNPTQHEYVQQYPSQSSEVLPYISQPYPTAHHGDPSQQTVQHHYQQMTHPIPVPQPHYNVVHHAKPKSLSVANATDEIWRCATDDFRSASHAIQMLRLAIVAEWESQRMMNEESFPKESNGWSYDPSETFLSLQGAALRFHARFEAMKAEKAGNNAESPLDGSRSERDGIEWELTEQAAWEVWEESVRASAALSHACVGPAWYRQIRMRRQLLKESEMRLIYHSYIQQQRNLFSDRSETSSLGGGSMSSTIASMDMSASQSIGMMSGMGPAPTINPPTDMLQMISHTIPEVLPAAMIRFAASAIETSIPPLRTKNSKIFWNPDKKNDSEFLLTSLGEILCEERRWLRRRRRLGDTQRDLAFALFCASAKKDKRRVNGYGSESTNSDGAGVSWSIPGCHVPVSSMIHSWLATCQAGWPVPNEFEQSNIPRHMENISSDPSEDHESPIPPKEIVLSSASKVDSTKSHDGNGVEFSYWGELVDLTTIDWWYTLKVLRDCSDLVAAGWRPPPTGQIGEEIVLGLVSIAEQGLEILFEATEDEEQLQKERLAAVSCASETLMALKNLALRDVLPSDSIYKLTTSLCHFLSAAESTPDMNEEAAGAMFQKEILAQRQFVAASAAELLWILLSSEDTACTTTDALLDAIDIDLSKTGNLSGEDCARAAGAIRALSAALWGDPPSVKGVPLLRFFWEPVLDILGRVTSTIFHSSDCTIKSSDIAGRASCLIVLNEGTFDDKLYVIVLEIVLSVRRLVDSEMVYGTGDLCPTEWEAFTKAIDFGFAPWLLYQGDDPLQLEICDEISAIFFQLQSFLLKCSQVEVGFHQIVDNDARHYLHLFLLRKVTPLLQLADAHKTLSLPNLDGTSIALATIKSWCVMGYLPYREGSWSKRASDLLQEAFALCENESDSNFIGGHLHSPVVRLEALKSLVYDSDDVTSSRDLDMMESDSMTASISTVTSASVKSGYITKHSLFSLTKNSRDLHLELIKTILLPRLISILAPEHQAQMSPDSMSLEPLRVPSPLANAIPSVHTAAVAEYLDVIEKECILRKFAIRKVGVIFRSRTGEDECRHQLIELLQLTATAPPHMIEGWARDKGGDDPTDLVEGAAREGHHIQVEAIRQLETCLHAPFRELPHTHKSVPTILKALCDTAIAHATEGNNLLTLASILPLARLSCAVNGQGIMMSRRRLTKIVPSDILSAISIDDYWSPTCDLNESLPMVSEDHDFDVDKDDVAPLIFVRQTQIEGKKEAQVGNDIGMSTSKFSSRRRSRQKDSGAREGTTVDFEIVAAVIKSVLQTSTSNHQQRNKNLFERTISHHSLAELPSIISTICYVALSSFLSHGMAFPSLDDSSWLNIEYSNTENDNEELLVARSQTIADFAGVLGHNFVYHLGDKKNNRDIARNVCYALVNLAKSKYSRVVTNACCGIILLLSSLRHSRKSAKMRMDDTSSSCLVSFIEYTLSVMREDTDTIILIPLIDAMREVFLCEGSLFRASKSLRRRAYLSCFKLQSNLWSVQAVAFQCAVAIIATMSAREISFMMFVSLAPNHNTTRTNRKRIGPLLFDILRTKLLRMRLLELCSNSETSSFKPLKVHNKLAREALSLESFPIDDINGCPSVSAWKCGNTILSLKMGSKDSLYRGWMEITIRSPSSRIRRLVQVKKENVCQDPDSLLPFWELLHEESAGQDYPPIDAPQTHRITEEDDEVTKAREMTSSQRDRISALISRFDKVFDTRSSEPNLPKTEVTKLPSGSRYYSESLLLRSNNKVKMLKRTCSDGDLLATTPLPRKKESLDKEDTASSVYSWLRQATKDSVDSNLIKELESFGFSSSALGVPSAIRDCASSKALFPQVLKPYENKPNFMRSLKILDRLTPFQTHRFALFYGGESGGSDSFLKTKHGSPDFWQFAKELGDIVPIRHLKYFSGGLDTSASRSDGVYAIVWFGNQGGSDELNYPTHVDSMVIFHTVTLMPNKETNRKRHVGNDVVHIVYGYEPTAISDDAKENEGSSISGHFGFITIYVVPLVHVDMVKVSVKLKSDLKENIIRSLDHLVGSWLISRRVGAHFVRNLAMQADLICQSLLEDMLGLVLNIEDRSGRIHEMDRHLKN